MFFEIAVLKNFRKIHRKTPVLNFPCNKVARPVAFFKNDSSTGVLL